jgi:hypothetical protein
MQSVTKHISCAAPAADRTATGSMRKAVIVLLPFHKMSLRLSVSFARKLDSFSKWACWMMCYDHRIVIMDIASVGDDSERCRRWEGHTGLSSGLKWAGLKSSVSVCTIEGQLEGRRCFVAGQRCCVLAVRAVRADRCSNMAANWNTVCVGLLWQEGALFGALLMYG